MNMEPVLSYPLAWILDRQAKPEDHHVDCSSRQTAGALLCDCEVIQELFNDRLEEYRQVIKTHVVIMKMKGEVCTDYLHGSIGEGWRIGNE